MCANHTCGNSYKQAIAAARETCNDKTRIDETPNSLTIAEDIYDKRRGVTAEESRDSLATVVESAWRTVLGHTKPCLVPA